MKKMTAAAMALSVAASAFAASPALAAKPRPVDSTPDVAALAGPLAKQALAWGPCDFGNPKYNERFSNAQCATMKVPRDWHNPRDGHTFDIRISRVITVDPKSPAYKGTITANPGGPGGDGLVWGPGMAMFTPQLKGSYNYLGFDPRGVGQSSHAVCEIPADAVEAAQTEDEVNRLIAGCQANPDVRAVNTEQTVYDMDFMRYLNGVPKLSYVGYSYGTWLGSWYGAVFAKNADKFVLDSAMDVTESTMERTFDLQPYARDRQFEEHMMNWIARHNDELGLGTVPSQVLARYQRAADFLGDELVNFVWSFLGAYAAFPNNDDYPLGAAAVQIIVEVAEEEQAGAADPAALTESAMLAKAEQLLNTSKADRSVLAEAKARIKSEQAAQAALAETVAEGEPFLLDEPFYWISCQDGQYDTNLARQQAKSAKKSADNPLSRALGLTGVSPCAYFRTNLSKPAPGKDFPKTILIQGELDSQTAWEAGRESGTSLPNTTMIAIDNEGSHGHFPYGYNTVDQPVLDLFQTGTLLKRNLTAQGKPLPGDDTTWESWKRLNQTPNHVGRDEDNAWQPIKTTGSKGHPRLPEGGLTVSALAAASGASTAGEDAARQLRRLQQVR